MHIMLDLPTIKTDFLFENQTTHGRAQDPIVFIHNIVYILTVLVL